MLRASLMGYKTILLETNLDAQRVLDGIPNHFAER